MNEFAYFLGRFHVLALHLPIGIILLALVLELLSSKDSMERRSITMRRVWAAAAVATIGTAALGYLHFAEGGFSGESAVNHRLYGTVLAVAVALTFGVCNWRPQLYQQIRIPVGVTLVLLVAVVGHYGGNLTHGPGFLTAYAPARLQSMLGVASARAHVTDPALADPYLDVIAPILESRCATCHNESKRRGGLDLSSYEGLRAGGETGSVITPGNADISDLYRRATLPKDDEEFMPKEGKTPLTAEETQLLRWWIQAGAPTGEPFKDVQAPSEIAELVTRRLQPRSSPRPDPQQVESAAIDDALVAQLESAGFLVRPVALTDARLVVSAQRPGERLSQKALEALKTASSRVVSLDLQDSGINDQDVAGLSELASIQQLRLSRNSLSDAGVESLASLPQLQTLNLYGNPSITANSVPMFSNIKSLRRLFVWGTGLNSEAIATLQRLRPDLVIVSTQEFSDR